MTKRCTKCNEEKNISEFHEDISKRDGLYPRCKICHNKSTKEYSLKNRNNKIHIEHHQEADKKYRMKNIGCRDQYQKEYRRNNRERINERRKNNRARDPQYRFNNAISTYIRISLKNGRGKNGKHWEAILYYNINELKTHIESLFLDGMTWDNYGTWHLDHILPVSLWKFDSYNDREFQQCWSLANLQPMWAIDNRRKSNKIL